VGGRKNCVIPLTCAIPERIRSDYDDPAVPANAALRLAVDTKEGKRPDPSWSRRPGRPRHTWADQVREDAGIPLSTLWSAEVAKGHGAVRRSSTRRQ